MNKNYIFSVLIFVLFSFQTIAQTNDFYDDVPTQKLKTSEIIIGGEISNGGKINLEKAGLKLHSIIYKETKLIGARDSFIGSYRVDGYSLYDILNEKILQKKNETEFKPIIDLYVEIENAAGEKTVLSWGEIYYPIHCHEIIIATQIMRIVPSKTKELWTLPTDSKLVVGGDLLSERNISMPTKITVKSYAKTFVVNKGMKPMYAEKIKIFTNDKLIDSILEFPKTMPVLNYPSVFYGRGTGIHGTTPFNGILLKDLLKKNFTVNKENLQKGILVVVGKDGYRAVYTFSEVFNRNDQSEFLLIDRKDDNTCGAFQLFPAPDFFSDRAIKSVMEIHFSNK